MVVELNDWLLAWPIWAHRVFRWTIGLAPFILAQIWIYRSGLTMKQIELLETRDDEAFPVVADEPLAKAIGVFLFALICFTVGLSYAIWVDRQSEIGKHFTNWFEGGIPFMLPFLTCWMTWKGYKNSRVRRR